MPVCVYRETEGYQYASARVSPKQFNCTWQTQWLGCLHVAATVGCRHFLQSLACATVCRSGTTTTTSCLPQHNMSDMFLTWSGRKGGHCATRPTVRWVLVYEEPEGSQCDEEYSVTPRIVHTFLYTCRFYRPPLSHFLALCLCRQPGMKATPLAGWGTGPGMLPGGKRRWKHVHRKWIKRWRLSLWWFVQNPLFITVQKPFLSVRPTCTFIPVWPLPWCVLGQSKEQTEQALAATAVPLEVSNECLTLRDGRRGYELVIDPADEQLKKEVALIERVQQALQQHIDKAFEQLW